MSEAMETVFIWILAVAVAGLMLGLVLLIGYAVYREIRGGE